MSRVHDVLRWAKRRDVAEEVTRRGYRVSGETLNRWVRDEKEFPAIVERIVFELFTISGHEETPPPDWAGVARIEGLVRAIAAATPGVELEELSKKLDAKIAADLEASRRQAAERIAGRADGQSDVSPGSRRRTR